MYIRALSGFQILSSTEKYFILEDIRCSSLSVNSVTIYPASIYMLKMNNINTSKGCEISSKLAITTP